MKNYKLLVSFLALMLLYAHNEGIPLSPVLAASKGQVKPKPKNAPLPKPGVKPIAPKSEAKEINNTIKNIVSDCKTQATLAQLIGNPENWLNKEVCINGTFSSFSALALDYPPAMRERKKYISLTLFRPNTQIPLSELKLSMKIDEAQKHELLPKASEGDTLKIKGKVFSTALGEPWMDILQIQVTKDPNSKNNNNNGFDEL